MSFDSHVLARRHTHQFGTGNALAELNTRRAFFLTAAMMVVEIIGGWWFNSMAVLADGWHMSSHALALGLSGFAYAFARRHADNPRFAFGTWKVEILGGYTSALLLLGVAAFMAFESVQRLRSPSAIQYDEAIAIAIAGLMVNLVCAWLLRDHHDHGHDHGHGHGSGHEDHHHAEARGHHADLNLRAAYVHVLADAATSVLAIVALFGGKVLGAAWLDPVMGIVGAALVTSWAWGLLRDAGSVLLDAEMHVPVVGEIREAIEQGEVPARIVDLHVWRVGRSHYACVVGVVTPSAVDADHFRRTLGVHEELVHVTVEVNRIAEA